MSNKITIVTGFFDIGRKDYTEIPRTNENYISYFSRWARIQNDMVCYVETQELADRVLEIRDQFGLKDKTVVSIVENIFSQEPELLAKMEEVSQNEDYLNFRERREAPENKAKYDYIMLMKAYCLKDASENFVKDGYVAWIDFGWEHGGRAYESEKDYEFEWSYDFGDKVNLFYIPPITQKPIFEMVRTLGPDCVMGAPIVCPVGKAAEFYNTTINSMWKLVEFGVIDDDQLVFTLAQRNHPELIELKPSYWFMPIRDYGGSHMRAKPPKKKTFCQKIKSKVKKLLGIRR